MPPKRATRREQSGSDTIPEEADMQLRNEIEGEEIADGSAQSPRNDNEGEEQETVEQRYERLKLMVELKRKQEAIAEMERELAGDDPAFRADYAVDSAPRGHKRPLSSNAPIPEPTRTLRPSTPPTFTGRNLQELRRYEAGWNVYFRAVKIFASDASRIDQAAASLREKALDEWDRADQEAVRSWKEYIDWCGSIIKDPATRRADASLRLKRAAQRQGQSVRDIARYIEEIERDIPEQTPDVAKAYVVLDALDDRLRRQVIRELAGNVPSSREQVVSIAQRIEELSTVHETTENRLRERPRRSENPNTISTGRTSPFPSRGNSRGGAWRTIHRTSTTPTTHSESSTTTSDSGVCFNCRQPGHIAKYCLQPKPNQPSKNDQTRS